MPLMFPPPWTAVGFVAAGLSLFLARDSAGRTRVSSIGHLAAVLVLAIGGIVWGEFLSGRQLGFDRLLFPGSLLSTVPHPGRPAPATAFNFSLLGLGLLLITRTTAIPALIRELTAITSFTYCYLGLMEFLIHTGRGSASYEVMVPVTATLFLGSSAALLLSRPDGPYLSLLRSSGPAGIFARWLTPVPLILPVLTMLVRAAGQRYGLFESGTSGAILSFVDILAAILIVWGS